MDDTKCLVELSEVLSLLNEEEYKKIPKDLLELIEESKDKEYIWEYDKSKSLLEQNLNRKTITMLSYINMEYLLDDKQKSLLQKMHILNELKLEKEKLKKYNGQNLFKNENNAENFIQKEKTELIVPVYEKLYKRLFIFFRNLLKKINKKD